MIKNANPNRIKPCGYGCIHCGKHYKTRTYLERHVILCETLVKAKKRNNSNNSNNANNNEKEDLLETPPPSPKIMYKIILELSLKCNRLEEKLEQIQKSVIKKKKQINIVEWLQSESNTYPKPTTTWKVFIDNQLQIEKEETELILHNPFLDVLSKIANRIFETSSTEPKPIIAFNQKPNTFFIYSEDGIWTECPKEKMLVFLQIIHHKYIKSFTEWKKKNEIRINESDSLCALCNKAISKMMDIHFKHEPTYNKARTILYNELKTDLKICSMEYEFE
jgi:hypothetical protein